MQRALEAALTELVFGQRIEPNDPAAIDAWCDRHGVDPEDRAFLRRGGLERLGVYRRLVRGTLLEAIELSIPRVKARLGALFDAYFDRFLEERAPRTRYLRDVTEEFLDFCEPAWRRDPRVPSYLIELGRHEALRIIVGSLPVLPRDHEPGELELDRGVDFIEAVRLTHYEHAVHRLSEDEADRSAPSVEPTYLFVYRSPEHEVRYLELTPLAAGILRRLLARQTLRQAVVGACEEQGVALDQGVIQGAAKVLADLAERGALLGASGVEPS